MRNIGPETVPELQTDADGRIVRGRYEAHVTPSLFLGDLGHGDPDNPSYGGISDWQNDDPDDIRSADRWVHLEKRA